MMDGGSMRDDGWIRLALAFLLLPIMAPLAVAEAPEAGKGALRQAPVATDDAFLEILLAWARGSGAAVAELSDFQQRLADDLAGFEITAESVRQVPSREGQHRRGLFEGRVLPGSRCLRELERFVDAEVARYDPEALLPLAVLTYRLYARQMDRSDFRPWLAERSEARAFQLIDSYRQRAAHGPESRGESRRNAAAMYVAMTGAQLGAGLEKAEIEARKLLRRALELDPENLAAHYWIAFLAERAGDYGDATRHLKAFEVSSPGDLEVALRLAINLARTGRRSEAVAGLGVIARAAGDPDSDWLRILAYQELGRVLGDRSAAAADWLREGVRRFPRSERLRLQLSQMLRDDWRRASELVSEVEADWRGDSGASPRGHYCLPRLEELDAELELLERAAARRRNVLALALTRLKRASWQGAAFAGCPPELPP